MRAGTRPGEGRVIEFGLFCGGHVPASAWETDPQAEHTRIMDEVRTAQVADRTGWKYWWTTEHHFLEEYSHISANEVLLAHVAAVTEQIHVGSGIYNITPPVNHPARIAERVAMADHLSNGRFEFGTGRGSSTTEQSGFGIDDPELTRDMFDEVITEFRKMWSSTAYSHDGEFFTMPERNILPKPYIRPHPPMWVAAGNPGTFEKAARMGLGVLCFSTTSAASLKPLIDIYKETISEADPVGDYVNDSVAVVSSFLCLEDRDRARQLMAESGTGYHNSLLFRYLDTFPKPDGIPDWPALLPDPTREQVDAAADAHASCVGDPEDCAAAIEVLAGTGADQILLGPSSSVWPGTVVEESIELFGTDVIPQFDTDPEHRTSRFRREAAERLGR